MTRYLVAYYSWTGATAKIAKALAESLSADLEEIRDAKPRDGAFAFIRSAFESARQKAVAIGPAVNDVADYDVVILGCPVWAHDMASPMRAYILRERSKFRRLALFCTLRGAGGEAALGKIAGLCGRASIADLQVTQAALKSGEWRASAQDLAARIRAQAQPAQAGAAP